MKHRSKFLVIVDESKELNEELLDFIENEFEDNIGDFEKVIVYEEECYNVQINIIQLWKKY